VPQPRPPLPPGAWLSLGAASRLLGVDPDTLRRWADGGRISAFVTPGGHRRFERGEIERLVADRRPGGVAGRLAGLGATPDRVSAAYRRRYAATTTEVGHVAGSVPTAEREAFRRDGRRLVEALLAHLDAPDALDRARALALAEGLVDDLARRLAGSGTSLTEATGLFVAARRPFLAELATLGRRRALGADRLSRIYEAAARLLDRLLLRLISTHQAALEAAKPPEPGR
jgi:excisionase family DNA binding protein